MSNNKQSSLEKEFVPYKEALALKELGFDEPCFGKWLSSLQSNWKEYELILEMGMNEEFEDNRNSYLLEGACSAPTFLQAFRWFREKYGIFNPQRLIFKTLGGKYGLQSHDEHDQVDGYFDSYEEAELACLRRLIEIVNKNNNEQQ